MIFTVAIWLVSFAAICVLCALYFELRSRHIFTWLWSYISRRYQLWRELPRVNGEEIHVLFCMVDHFEPISKGSTSEQQRGRMLRWRQLYPTLARKHRDSNGFPIQHTWFYPGEDYNSEYLDDLVALCKEGIGEIELHLHHGYDTTESLKAKLFEAMGQFEKHGALQTSEVPTHHTYGFIHGNMALDNSRNDPSVCGVNAEITVLKETGCYADFSMPTASCVSQTRKINSIYYSHDDPHAAKSHDTGIDVEVGGRQTGDLMIIQGPLSFNWHSRKWLIVPKIENAEIQSSCPPTPDRVRNWVRQHIHVKGRPEWIIVKVSCHGAEDRSADVLLGNAADKMYSYLEEQYRDRCGFKLHYVTARELFNIIKAAEAGLSGNPNLYRDYVIAPYKTHEQCVQTQPKAEAATPGVTL